MTAVDVIVFEVAGTRYGAELAQVARVDSPRGLPLIDSVLGRPWRGHRALVFAGPSGDELGLEVDAVHGVASVPLENLRRMPPASGSRAAVGAWVTGETTVLLINLHALAVFPDRKSASP